MQMPRITNQLFPLNLTHRRSRHSRLPNNPRSNPYMEINHGQRY